MALVLVERHYIKTDKEIIELCRHSKDLFNKANYILRQRFFKKDKFPGMQELVNLVSGNECFKKLHNTKTAKQTLLKLWSDWSNFFKSLAAYGQDKSKFKKCPRPPGYKKNMAQVMFYDETIRKKPARNGILTPTNDCFLVPSKKAFKQVTITPKKFGFIIDVSYDHIENKKTKKAEGDGICSIDFGVNNLCAITSDKHTPILINGRIIKSINQIFNKRINKRSSRKRYFRIENYFHHTAKYIIDLCIEHGIKTIILGRNKLWKERKRNNQNFQCIPFYKLRQKIMYKALIAGITIIDTEESYTSQSSFLDRDPLPTYGEEGANEIKFSGKRRYRGLYVAKDGRLVNADVNGSANICRKVIHDVEYLDRMDRSLAARPLRINPLKAFVPNFVIFKLSKPDQTKAA